MISAYAFCPAALIACAFILIPALPYAAQEPPREQAPAAPTVAPRPEHDRLRFREGIWDVTMEFTPAPGANPVVAKGTQTNRLTLNGLWLISDLEAEMMGRPFMGHGVNGFDPSRGKYVGIWIDSMRTYVTQVEGEYEKDGRVFRTTSQERDPSGRMVPSTQITETIDKDTERTTLTAQAADGKAFTRMTITYRRRR